MNWTDEYREIVEFYYWQPQDIGRANGVKRFKNADEMWDHVSRIEVSLNHVLNIFFSLYPLHKLDCFDADDSHVMLSAWQLELLQREQKNATQPDTFFEGNNKNIAIELKTASKSDLAQVIKYIRFNEALLDSESKDFELVMLTPFDDISKVFKEKYQTIMELQDAIQGAGVTPPKISIISFNQLLLSLKAEHTHNETEEKLVAGLISYLYKRPELNIATESSINKE